MNSGKRNLTTLMLVFLVTAFVAFPASARKRTTTSPTTTTTTAWGTSDEGIEPERYPGNFVSSDDDQVCYDMSGLGIIGRETGEMRGFKIDPPVSYNDGNVATTISPDGKSLSWSSNATVLGFIIKGGPNFHVYDYVGSGIDADGGLVSPLNKKSLPAISHYNVCYQVTGSGEGCTPGYWRNHGDRWLGAHPTDDFDTTFGVDLFNPNISLGQAIWLGGGGANALARHATAALLNSYGGVPNGNGVTVDYPYTTAQVIQMVQDAVANGTIEATKNLLAAANEAGCPLSGTRANPV
jgi:hypothetical protein